ncbi:Uncharacterized protein dnm_048200 [Desulfonema magnum]|uniref:Uncharacterized protein n=1 Tax=Desulfonema magnum TaxID=45655 RepID=A0A975BP48_9BACT|nr:Uncharacterized protein dnm_048200 [Desulfonema magnum]
MREKIRLFSPEGTLSLVEKSRISLLLIFFCPVHSLKTFKLTSNIMYDNLYLRQSAA